MKLKKTQNKEMPSKTIQPNSVATLNLHTPIIDYLNVD